MTVEFAANQPKATVPALTIEVDENSIRDYLELSNQLPVLVLFVSGTEPTGAELRGKLTELTAKAQGRILTLVVDGNQSPELAKAFEVQGFPSLFALLKGQPAPLFTGAIAGEQLTEVLTRVMDVATQNGLTWSLTIEPAEAELPESHRLAFEAIDRGDYHEALRLYHKALAENPNDSLAEAGLAQVNLLVRLADKDLQEILNTKDPSKVLDLADAHVATGNPGLGFDLLLESFASTPKPERDEFRLRLLELFLTVGAENPAVFEARKKLSLLLF